MRNDAEMRKTASGRNESGFHNQKIYGRQINGFNTLNFRTNGNKKQCKRCRSDYMHAATENGICLDCDQHDEFLYRERRVRRSA